MNDKLHNIISTVLIVSFIVVLIGLLMYTKDLPSNTRGYQMPNISTVLVHDYLGVT